VRVDPESFLAHVYLSDNLAAAARWSRVEHFRIAIRLEPRILDIMDRYANELATCEDENNRNVELAIQMARQVCELTSWKNPDYIATLAEVYSEAGRPVEARDAAQRAIELARGEGDPERTERLRLRLPDVKFKK